jgi:hypothetical protein
MLVLPEGSEHNSWNCRPTTIFYLHFQFTNNQITRLVFLKVVLQQEYESNPTGDIQIYKYSTGKEYII